MNWLITFSFVFKQNRSFFYLIIFDYQSEKLNCKRNDKTIKANILGIDKWFKYTKKRNLITKKIDFLEKSA
jgi:hypothetical protein